MWNHFFTKLWGLLVVWLLIIPSVWAAPGPSVIVHFGNDKAVLDDLDKERLRKLFQSYDVRQTGRVFILGYTDSSGNKQYNYKLSRKRAQSVRREIIDAFGIDATVVMALGKGPENPIGDNAKANGRASNRRAEIYLANAAPRQPKRIYGPNDPHLPDIKAYIKQADDLIRQRRINDAMQQLQRALALGGDHYTDWHTAMGIAGFYADAPADRVKAHLSTALRMDPYNYKAREFLSRIEARLLVAGGQVTPEMGRTVTDAIAVTAAAQEYEYLKLFGMQALAHHQLDLEPVTVWECLDPNGQRTAYYFNHAQTFSWAFGNNAGHEQSQRESTNPVVDVTPPASNANAIETMTRSKDAASSQPDLKSTDNPQKIWQSTLYR